MIINNQYLIPKGKGLKPEKKMKPQYVTIHTTQNPSANAQQHASASKNGHLKNVAVHYFVDDQETVYQCLSDTEQGWHAGDGNGSGNTKSIAIEICDAKNINFENARSNGAMLCAMLAIKYDIPIEHVVPHRFFYSNKYPEGKNCPKEILPTWPKFLQQVQDAMLTISQQPASPPAPKPKPAVTPPVKPTIPPAIKGKPSVNKPTVIKAKTTADLFLRIAPSMSARILATMPNGSMVEVLSKDNSLWWKVKYNGQEGYAGSRYLTLQ